MTDTVNATRMELRRAEKERDGLQFSNVHGDVTSDDFDMPPSDCMGYDTKVNNDGNALDR